MDIPEITDIDDTSRSLRLKWRPKSMSPFNKGPITYQIERWEPTQRHWTHVASGVRDTTYKVTGLPFDQDHLFRIRAEAEKLLSEPTYPISFNRFRCKSAVFFHVTFQSLYVRLCNGSLQNWHYKCFQNYSHHLKVFLFL